MASYYTSSHIRRKSTSQYGRCFFSCLEEGEDQEGQRDNWQGSNRSEREMATPLFLLRSTEVGNSTFLYLGSLRYIGGDNK